MRHFIRPILVASPLVFTVPAFAASIQYDDTITNANGQSVTAPQNVSASKPLPTTTVCTSGCNGTNASVGTNGAAIPGSSTLIGTKDGSGNIQPASSASPVPVNVVAGSSGGGAVYGPTAAGSAAANPPVLLGGTQDGTNTGTVRNARVSSSGLVSVDGSAVTQPISASSLPLPTGAATAANQATANTSLATIATNSGSSIPAGSAIIGKVGIDQTTDGTTNAVHLVAGTAIAGKVGIDQTTPGTTNAVQSIAGTSGGASITFSANVTNTAQSVKGSAGQLYWYYITNNNSAVCYLQIYNIASGSVTVGTSTPTISLGIPANSSSGGAANGEIAVGVSFGAAISVAASTTRANAAACTSGLDVNIVAK